MANLLQTKYWPHIDGLRAFAVMAVLFFHFKTPGFSDGYLGVDIFFVISGFLVSRLILKDIEEFEKVRFGRFFARRIRRLFPTLAAVCVVTAIIAYGLLDNERLTAFGKSVGAAIISLSNINFWSESGYFDTGSDTKPLLHTWSLSVEEQFYLFWPAAKMFTDARALKADEVKAMITRFADTAEAAKSAGFDGVQIHAAHGYLVAQFLSPLSNLREDEWGGSLENRARFLLEIVRAVRERTGKKFGLAVKLNSADFQRGGFDVDDAKQVVKWLNKESVDFVELSGGSYESAAMAGAAEEDNPSSTMLREIYFIEFAKEIEKIAKMPLMVTGGITKRETAEMAMESGAVEIVGIARAYGYNPYIARDWAAGQNTDVRLPEVKSKNKTFKVLATMGMTKANLYTMGEGGMPKAKRSPLIAVIRGQMKQAKLTKQYRKWLDQA